MPLSRCKSENKFLFLSYVRKVANENFSPLGGANNPPLPGIVDSVHGDQDQVEIAYHRKQAVEGSLIRYRTAKGRFAILRQSDLHSVEHLRPERRKMTFDTNLIKLILATISIHFVHP